MTAETTVRGIIDSAVAAGREALTPDEAKRICDAYDIPSADPAVAASATEAVAIAERIGYPVAAKIVSPDIAHKTDAGGVVLDIGNAEELARAHDSIVANARAFDAGCHHRWGTDTTPTRSHAGHPGSDRRGGDGPRVRKTGRLRPRWAARGSTRRHHVPVGAGYGRRDFIDARRHRGRGESSKA